MEGKGCRGVQF